MLYYIRSTGFSRQNDPVARAVFHGKRGELRQHYRDGQRFSSARWV